MKLLSSIILSLAFGVAMAACTSAGTPTLPSSSPGAPLASADPAPSTASSSAGPSADPSERAGRDYLAALTRYLSAIDDATDACAGQTLGALQRCFGDSARALGTFRSRVAGIAFPDAVRDQVTMMLVQAGDLHALLTAAANERSVERIQSHWWPLIDDIDVAVLEAAQAIRKAMGLPPSVTD